MSKRELQVGQKIRFTGPFMTLGGEGHWNYSEKDPVEIIGFAHHGSITIAIPEREGAFVISRRQVTHVIKPRAPKETKPDRVERWYKDGKHSPFNFETYFKEPAAGAVHLVELRPGEIILDRAKLAEAWDTAFGPKAHSDLSSSFPFVCKALGLLEAKP